MQSQEYNTLINVFEKESSILIEWFDINCMQANPDKFQAIAVGKKLMQKNLFLILSLLIYHVMKL